MDSRSLIAGMTAKERLPRHFVPRNDRQLKCIGVFSVGA